MRRMSPFASATEEFESERRMKEIGELLRYFISRRKVNFKYVYYERYEVRYDTCYLHALVLFSLCKEVFAVLVMATLVE